MGFFRFKKSEKSSQIEHPREDQGTDPAALEREASEAFSIRDFETAFGFFRKAADIYKSRKNHKQAALCYVSAASCWSLKSEEKTFFNAAVAYDDAARQADSSGDLEYASLLYKYAGINYERDGEFSKMSDCVYLSKECLRHFLIWSFIYPGKIKHITESEYENGAGGAVKKFSHLVMLTFSWALWGHGERPMRSFLSVVGIIIGSAVLYSMGHIVSKGTVVTPDLADALYFSIVTFTTVGYGDMSPVGMTKVVAMMEVFSGVFIMPLFIMALTRKYLRM